MANSLGKFIENLTEVTASLWAVLKKDAVFSLWLKNKSLINSALIIKIFDPDLPTTLKIDESSKGLGALLQQSHGLKEISNWYAIG